MLHVMSGAGPLEPPPGSPEGRRRKAAGTWAGSLIFVLCLLFFLVFDAQAAYQHQWANVTGITVFAVLFLIVPTGGARWLRRVLKDRKSPKAPDGVSRLSDQLGDDHTARLIVGESSSDA